MQGDFGSNLKEFILYYFTISVQFHDLKYHGRAEFIRTEARHLLLVNFRRKQKHVFIFHIETKEITGNASLPSINVKVPLDVIFKVNRSQ